MALMAQSIALCLAGEFRPGLLGSSQQLRPRDVAPAAKPSCSQIAAMSWFTAKRPAHFVDALEFGFVGDLGFGHEAALELVSGANFVGSMRTEISC